MSSFRMAMGRNCCWSQKEWAGRDERGRRWRGQRGWLDVDVPQDWSKKPLSISGKLRPETE